MRNIMIYSKFTSAKFASNLEVKPVSPKQRFKIDLNTTIDHKVAKQFREKYSCVKT